jgi:hypothetical protein
MEKSNDKMIMLQSCTFTEDNRVEQLIIVMSSNPAKIKHFSVPMRICTKWGKVRGFNSPKSFMKRGNN